MITRTNSRSNSTDNSSGTSEEDIQTYRRLKKRRKDGDFCEGNKAFRYSFNNRILKEIKDEYEQAEQALNTILNQIFAAIQDTSSISDNDTILTHRIKTALNAALKDKFISHEEIKSPPNDLFELIPGLVLAYQMDKNLPSNVSFQEINFNFLQKSDFQLHTLQEDSGGYDISEKEIEEVKAIFKKLTSLIKEEDNWLLHLNEKLRQLNQEEDRITLKKMTEPYDKDLNALGKIFRKVGLQSFFSQRKTWINSLAKVFSELQAISNKDAITSTSNI